MKNKNLNGHNLKKYISVLSLLALMTISGCSGDVFQRLTGEKVLRVDVTPVGNTIVAGTSLQFKTISIYSNNKKEDITDIAEWKTSDASIATVSELGIVTSKAPGTVTVSAVHKGVSGSAQLTVSNAVLVSVSVTPLNPIVGKGTTQQFNATGIFSDHSTQDLTSAATWTSSNNSVATVSNAGLANTLTKGSATITASYVLNGSTLSGSTLLGITDATLVSIEVTPTNPSKAKGTTEQFTATGIFSDGSHQNLTTMVTWSSSNNSIATVGNTGSGSAVNTGAVTITATSGTISGRTDFSVTDADLVSITVTPGNPAKARGTTQQFTAMGTYSDNSTQDLTVSATWSSSNPLTAHISNTAETAGLANALNTGTAIITATSGSVSGQTNFTVTDAALVSISITPLNPSRAKGTTQQFTATGIYTDNSTQDLTTSVTWSSSNSLFAAIGNASGSRGSGTAVNNGTVTITAAAGSIIGSTGFTVTDATLASISITPANPVRAKGTSQQFTATGTYTDNTTQNLTSTVTWASSKDSIATITNATGLGSAVDTGDVTVTAISGTVTGSTSFTVTAATLVSISVTPSNPVNAKGTTQQFTATGLYTDGSNQNLSTSVTWSSSDNTIAGMNNVGLCTTLSKGTATITASMGGLDGTANITVTDATLVSINLSPANTSGAKGTTRQFSATGIYTDSSTQDLTTQVTWFSSNTSAVTISTADGTRGLANAFNIGSTTITATSGSVSGNTNFSVTTATLESISVSPTNPSSAKGTTESFTATGIYTDSHTQDLTTQVTWSSSNTSVATISSAVGSEGLATAEDKGTVTITATSGTVSGNATFTVTDATLVSISVNPTNPSIAKGTAQTFTATGTYTDSHTQDLTTQVTWSSSNTSAATISSASGSEGIASSVNNGTATITATLGTVSGDATLTVTDAILVSISVTTADQNPAKGTSIQLTATGTYTDNSTQNLTSSALWTSSNSLTATVSNQGLCYSANIGTASITAASGTVSGSINITVKGATLTSIQVTPTNPTKAKGTYQQFKATGIYSDSTTMDLTSSAAWESSDLGISNITASGLAYAGDIGTSSITASLGSIHGSTSFTITGATLVSISVSPADVTIAKGTTQQFTATGIYTDGSNQNITSQVTWSSTNSSVASVSVTPGSEGLGTGLLVGSVTITAIDPVGGIINGTANFRVTNASLDSISVTPTNPTKAKGTTQQFIATGTYSDHSTQILTASVTWTSSNDSIASVSNTDGSKGLGTAVNEGNATIYATQDGKTGSTGFTVTKENLVSISVAPTNQSKAKGTSQQFTATGFYSDSSNQDLTSQVTWSSTDESIAAVSNASGSHGLGTAVETGTVTITATYGGTVSGTTTFHVTDAALVSIAVTPINTSKAKGTTQQFTATGTYTDNSTQILTTSATWSSSNNAVATVSNENGSEGLGTAVDTGTNSTVTITATYGGISGSTSFTVTTATINSIQVTPVNSSKAKGTTQQFTATGIYTDGTTQNITNLVTWSSDDDQISTVSNASGSQGLVTAVDLGSVTITASLGGLPGSTTFNVTDATLASIGITPVSISKAKGTTQQFTATGIYTDNSTQDITTSVTWWSTGQSTAAISNVDGSRGMATAVNTGTVTITATQGTISGTTDFTVTNATLSSISITPANLSLTTGRTQQYIATGTYTDSTTQNLTDSVTWSSSSTSNADISNAGGSRGIATTIAAGTTNITATLGVVYGSTQLTVTNAELESITVSPVNKSLASGMKLQFQATGIYKDKSTQDLTASVTWISSVTGNATISNAAGSQGLASGVSAGSTIITARLGAITGTTTLTVTSANLISVTVSPVNQTLIANGTTLQFTATGTYSDSTTQNITSQVTWTSDSTATATISNASGSQGFVTSASPGVTTITATHSVTKLSSHTQLTVSNATLTSITITPDNPICYGTTQQFKATGNFSDSTTQDITTSVTWSSQYPARATISNAAGSNGLAVAKGIGSTIIKAELGTVSNTTLLEVRATTLNRIIITPADPSLVLPGSIQFTATGEYSDGYGGFFYQDLTTQVLWSSVTTGTAEISNASGSQGLASSIAAGTTRIYAKRDIAEGYSDLTVTADTTAPVITAVKLLDSARIQITYSEPVNVTQAGSESNYKISSTATGLCSDNSNYTGSGQTSDISISSVTVLSATDYILNITSSMQAINYTLLANKTQIRDLASTPNFLGCPNNMDFAGVDTTSPTLSSAASLNPTTVRITFSENVNASIAQNKTSYKIVDASAVTGSCSDNTDFANSTQTSDFTISSVSGSGKVYDIVLSSTQISAKSYTLIVNKSVINDLAAVPNPLGCPNYSDFTGLEQLKVSRADSASLYSFVVTFSKNVKAGVDLAGSAGATNSTQAGYRYKVSSELGSVTSARILDGTVCGITTADPSKVCVTHTLAQGGAQYTVIVANNVDSDGFDNTGWGSIRNSGDTENVQSSPKDRATFVGSGTVPQNLSDGAIVTNPFGDNSAFGYLSGYNGQIYIGPNSTGNGANRFNPDGSSPSQVTFSFVKDTTGNTSENIAAGPFYTIGHTGCTRNSNNSTTGCGPDNEDGRGAFIAGTLGTTSYLFIGGARSLTDFDYIYYSSDTDQQIDYKFIDLSALNGPNTQAFESMTIMDSRLYIGYARIPNNRPDFSKVSFNSIDGTSNYCTAGSSCQVTASQGVRLRIDLMPYFGGYADNGYNRNWSYYTGVDSLIVFNNMIYAANGGHHRTDHDGGIIRSVSSNPGVCSSSANCLTIWNEISPRTDSNWNNSASRFSLELAKTYDLIPADKAFPAFATFNSNLYAIRNTCTVQGTNADDNGGIGAHTVAGCNDGTYTNRQGQLWKCIPGTSGGALTCEATDWSLVANNGTTGITNFGDTNNKVVSMLIMNGSRLYIGFDNVNGAQVWRTKAGVTNPTSVADFEQVGSSGLNGNTANTQIFSATSLQQGSVYYLYISAGNSGIPVKVFRQQNM